MAAYSGPGFALYNGVPILQSSSIDFDVQTDNKDVNTQLLGRSGHSPGPKKVQVNVNSAIPQGGLEFDWVAIANAQLEVPLAFKLAGTTYLMRGDVRNVKISTSVDKANEVTFEFHGSIESTVS